MPVLVDNDELLVIGGDEERPPLCLLWFECAASALPSSIFGSHPRLFLSPVPISLPRLHVHVLSAMLDDNDELLVIGGDEELFGAFVFHRAPHQRPSAIRLRFPTASLSPSVLSILTPSDIAHDVFDQFLDLFAWFYAWFVTCKVCIMFVLRSLEQTRCHELPCCCQTGPHNVT